MLWMLVSNSRHDADLVEAGSKCIQIENKPKNRVQNTHSQYICMLSKMLCNFHCFDIDLLTLSPVLIECCTLHLIKIHCRYGVLRLEIQRKD